MKRVVHLLCSLLLGLLPARPLPRLLHLQHQPDQSPRHPIAGVNKKSKYFNPLHIRTVLTPLARQNMKLVSSPWLEQQ